MALATLGEKEIGSVVKILVDGIARDFIVVQHGRPSAIYSYTYNDGVILPMKDVYVNHQWHTGGLGDYSKSAVHSYLEMSSYLFKTL